MKMSARLIASALVSVGGFSCGLAGAQTPPAAPSATPAPAPAAVAPAPAAQQKPVRLSGNPSRDTLLKLQRSMTIEFNETRLEDVIRFVTEFTSAEIEPIWGGDSGDGLDKEKLITLSVKNASALRALEKILEKAQPDTFSENGWQLSPEGALEIGPKAALNKQSRRVVVYDITDLITELPNYTEVPEIDLNSVLQQAGGGQGQSPFEDDDAEAPDRKTRDEKIRDLMDTLMSLVEPTQWIDRGGEGASMRAFNNTLIVNGPDYIHRQLAGYPFWPSHTTRTVAGRRYLTLSADTGISTVDQLVPQPVSAVVPPGGGG